MQESELLTADQLGAIHCEFDRLGLGNDDDRPRRLEILAVLTRQSDLASTTELVMGEAGRALRMLRSAGDLSELDNTLAGARAETGSTASPSIAQLRALISELVAALIGCASTTDESG